MYTLTDDDINFIRNDLIARGVEREDLQLNLLDHICCIIESELNEGDDFKQFYAQAIKRFYKKELSEIEEETTLLLTFKHYYAMKKTMIISGVISAVCFVAGTFLKFNHWPGAAVCFVLAFALFALLFLPLMFVLKMKENPEGRSKIIFLLAMLFGSFAVIGMLFKIMHWPGASVMMYSAIGGLALIFLPIYFFTGIRNPASKLNTIVTSVVLIAVAGIFMSLVSVRPSWFYHNMHVQSDQLLRDELGAITKVAERAEAGRAKDSSDAEIIACANSVTALTNKMIDSFRNAIGSSGGKAGFEQLSTNDNYDITNMVLFPATDEGAGEELKALRAELDKFQQIAAKRGAEFSMLNDSIVLDNGKKGPWEYVQFHNNSPAVAVRKLMLLQMAVRTAELEMIVLN